MYIGGNAFPKVMEIIVSIEKTMPMTNTWTKTKTDTKTKTKTTMGLKEVFINASLKLYINLCQAYTMTSPYFTTLP